MKQYYLLILPILLTLGLSTCAAFDNKTDQSTETSMVADEDPNKNPIRLNSNKRYIKHRRANRRVIHRLHRL